MKYLGVHLDENITFNVHINHLNKKISQTLGRLNSVRHLLPFGIRKQVYFSLIYSQITYCMSVWSYTSEQNIHRLSITLNRACRQVLNSKSRDLHNAELYQKLNWLNLNQLVVYHLQLDTFKTINRMVMHNITLPLANRTYHHYLTRAVNHYHILHANNSYGDKRPSIRMSRTWNALSPDMKDVTRISIFKRLIAP